MKITEEDIDRLIEGLDDLLGDSYIEEKAIPGLELVQMTDQKIRPGC